MDESLFDPYKDTEAMICRGVLEEAKMFLDLRSLAWIVSDYLGDWMCIE